MKIKELVDKAINFILETQQENDYICERNGEWCEKHCIDYLRRECVVHYLEFVYGIKEDEG